MSGSNSLLPINSGLFPSEKPRGVRVQISWGNTGLMPANIFPINLQQQAQTGQFSTCQSVYIDNSTVPYAIRMVENETGQVIFIPQFSTGSFPVLASSNPSFTVTLLYSSAMFPLAVGILPCTTLMYFMNVEVPYYTQQLPQYGNGSYTIPIDVNNPYEGTGLPQFNQLYPTSGPLLANPINSHLLVTSIYIGGFISGSGANQQNAYTLAIVEAPLSGPVVTPSNYWTLAVQTYVFNSLALSQLPTLQVNFSTPYICNAGNILWLEFFGSNGIYYNLNLVMSINAGFVLIQ